MKRVRSRRGDREPTRLAQERRFASFESSGISRVSTEQTRFRFFFFFFLFSRMQIGPTRRARVARSVRFYLKPLGVGRMRNV